MSKPTNPNEPSDLLQAQAAAEAGGDKPKVAIEIVYAKFLRADEDVKLAPDSGFEEEPDLGLYRWSKDHWRRTKDKQEGAEALSFLERRSPGKATARKSVDCLNTAKFALLKAGTGKQLQSPPRSSESDVYLPVGSPGFPSVYLKLQKNGTALICPPHKHLSMTYCINALFDSNKNPVGTEFTPTTTPSDSMWGGYLDLFLPDIGVRKALQEAVGASLLPINFEKAFFLLGSGSNGKSTFLTLLESLHPSRTSIMLSKLSDTHALASLPGRTLYVAAENSKFIGEVNEQIMKAIISRDLLVANGKFKDYTTFRPSGTLFAAMNSQYRSGDKTFGLKRKIQQLPFNVRLDSEDPRMDKNFTAKMLASPQEMAHFFNWALEGALRLLKNDCKFTEASDSLKDFDTQQSIETDDVFAFLLEHEASLETSVWTLKTDVYTAFRDFCRERGKDRIETDTTFFTRVNEYFRRQDASFVKLEERKLYAPKGQVRKRVLAMSVLGVANSAAVSS